MPHLEKMLKQGYILSGRYLPDSETRLGSWEKLPYVYCSIYFDDIKNMPQSFGYSLVIHPKIIKDKGIIFNKGWWVHPTKTSIFIKPNDIDYDKKMNLIEEHVKIPFPHIAMMNHEILIKDKIDLHKYLIALILPGEDGPIHDKIQKILEDNKYNNIKIFTTSNLPDFKDLF